MEKKQVAVYPFSREFVTPCEYLNALNGAYAVASLSAPRGWAMEGRDGGEYDGRAPLGLTVGSDPQQALEACDALLIPPGEHGKAIRTKSLRAMAQAAELGKEILCALRLEPEKLEEIGGLCRRAGARFIYLADRCEKEAVNLTDVEQEIDPIDVPVVFVGELFSGLHAEDALLSLTEAFRKKGYRVSGVLNRCYAELFSLRPMPSFLTERELCEADKIFRFNAYLKRLEMSERPDVLLVQLPGGMLRYNDRIVNDFGIYSFLISQAVQPDCFVLSAPCGVDDPDFYTMLSDCFDKRFGFEIDCTVLSPLELDAAETQYMGKAVFQCQNADRVKMVVEKLQSSQIPVYAGLTAEGRRAASERVFQALTVASNARALH